MQNYPRGPGRHGCHMTSLDTFPIVWTQRILGAERPSWLAGCWLTIRLFTWPGCAQLSAPAHTGLGQFGFFSCELQNNSITSIVWEWKSYFSFQTFMKNWCECCCWIELQQKWWVKLLRNAKSEPRSRLLIKQKERLDAKPKKLDFDSKSRLWLRDHL